MDPNVHSRIVINAENLTKRYRDLVAVDGISFAIGQGEVFGFLGPNGAGKTSTMKMISCVSPVTDGKLTVDGMDVNREQRDIKSLLGIVSQADSLDPGLNVIQNLLAFARYHNLDRDTARRRAWEALDLFQLRDKAHNSVDELSGGMRQRMMIAAALASDPDLLLADEPSTSLDVTVQAQILALLRELQETLGMAVIFVTHDLAVVAEIADEVAVMYGGRIVESAPVAEVLRNPQHPYTQGLLDATVRGQKKGTRLVPIPGAPPDLSRLPPGCSFAPRCSFAREDCLTEMPEERAVNESHMARCVLVKEGVGIS